MSKELEAFVRIARQLKVCDENGRDLDIIETALNENSELRTRNYELLKESEHFYNERNEYKRALEIIKEKDANVYWFRYVHKHHKEVETRPLYSSAFEAYNNGVKKERRLTQEEYELLKKVLL